MIVIDMDMPISCDECPICHPKGKDEPWNYACYQGMMDINLDEWDERRHPNCPIKCDIEDIKAEISNKERYVDFMNNYADGYNSALHDVLDIIDKHTKGDTDADCD